MADDTTRSEETNRLAEELNRLSADREGLLRSIRDLTQRQLQDLQKVDSLETHIKDIIAGQVNLLKTGVEYLRRNVEESQAYYDNVQKLGKGLHENNLKHAAAQDLVRSQIAYYRKILATQEGNVGEAAAMIKKLQKQEETLGRQATAIKAVETNLKKLNPLNSKIAGQFRMMGEAFKAGPHTFLASFVSLLAGPVTKVVKKAFGLLKKSVVDVFFAIDNATHSLQRATGMGERYRDSMLATYEDTRRYGVTMENLDKSFQSLITTVTDFTLLSDQAGQRLAETGAMLERVGVSVESYGAGLQASMKMFGQSWSEAESISRELLATSYELNIPPAQLAESYGKMGGQLAKLGRDGPQAFKELARVAKITGMEMEKVLQITNQFDTFESAAEMTGKLNAALGGNFVDAMGMMMETDPAARFESIREAIMSTGLTFDDMSYYQRQFYANSLGLSDVGDLALMMSGNMDMMSGATQQSAADYERLAEEAQATMSLQEKFNSFLAQLAPILEELMDKAHAWMDTLQENEDFITRVSDAIVTLSGFLVVLVENWDTVLWATAAVLGTFTLLSGIMFIYNLRLQRSIALGMQQIAQSPAKVAAMAAEGKTAEVTGKQAAKGSAGWLKLGAAIVLSGAGIALAAKGIAEMADAMAGMFEAAAPGQIQEAAMGFMSLAAAGTALIPASVGFALGSLGLIGMMNVLGGFDASKLESLATFTSSIANLNSDSLETLGTALEKVALAMDELPESKAVALTATFQAAEVAARAAQILAGQEPTGTTGAARATQSAQRGNTPNSGLMGTIQLTFNTELLEDRVIRLSRREAGTIVANAVNELD